ncbi:MAG: response regulator [Flavobacteriales bacterium]|nr:response regulator [Flavobacteriales bacterium]
MAVKVLIVEDEVLVAEEIAADLEDYGFEITGIAISSEECLNAVAENKPQIILMDIQIRGDQDGIETAKHIQQNANIPVIYLTANTDTTTVSRALKTAPHAFISKPYNKRDLAIAIEIAFNKNNENILTPNRQPANDAFFVKSGDYYTKVNVDDVTYIAADGSYCTIHTADKEYTLSTNLNHFQNNQAHPSFIRTHRSYIVNFNKVEAFNKDSLLIGRQNIPVSKSHQKDVMKFFNKL